VNDTSRIWRTCGTLVLAIASACGPSGAVNEPRPAGSASEALDAVVIHPPVAVKFHCSEHPLGSEDHAGDALAADCRVVRDDGGPFGNFPRLYSGDGTRNEDWFSWNEPLLAPFDGVVKLILRNPVTNQPGTRGKGPSSAVLFERFGDPSDRPIQVGYVHVQDLRVELGDTVRVGEVVARIGNNGISDAPHVHVGALRGDLTKVMSGEVPGEAVVPLQVRFDLAAMGRLRGYVR
jgi:hypothetical protein